MSYTKSEGGSFFFMFLSMCILTKAKSTLFMGFIMAFQKIFSELRRRYRDIFWGFKKYLIRSKGSKRVSGGFRGILKRFEYFQRVLETLPGVFGSLEGDSGDSSG